MASSTATRRRRRPSKGGAVSTLLVASSVPNERRDELVDAVQAQGGEYYIVPAQSNRGTQFAEAFGGVGGLTAEGDG
jgi:stalled ribosome rescue protein Dom34